MKNGLMPQAMWRCFQGSFMREMYRMSKENPRKVMAKARKCYQNILVDIPEFEKGDPFLTNILSAAMLASVYLELEEKPNLEQVTDFYHHAMTNNMIMKCFLKLGSKYTPKAQAKLKRQGEESVRRSERNPYTWCFRYETGRNINCYSAIFTHCGILYLLKLLDIPEICPAMCTYDYDMAELSGSTFIRKLTLAGGEPCCDCHWTRKS